MRLDQDACPGQRESPQDNDGALVDRQPQAAIGRDTSDRYGLGSWGPDHSSARLPRSEGLGLGSSDQTKLGLLEKLKDDLLLFSLNPQQNMVAIWRQAKRLAFIENFFSMCLIILRPDVSK